MLKKLTFIIALGFLVPGLGGLLFWARHASGAESHVMVLGIFMVGLAHNLTHIFTGTVGLLSVRRNFSAKWFLRTMGLAYAALAIIGLMVSIPNVGFSDNILHAVFGAAMLGIGCINPKDKQAPSSPTQRMVIIGLLAASALAVFLTLLTKA